MAATGQHVTASDAVAPEYARWVAERRRSGALSAPPVAMDEGTPSEPLHLDPREATALVRTAALRAVGLYRPTSRTEVVWVEGGRALAIGVAGIEVITDDGLLTVLLPVRCDQLEDVVTVTFAVGSESRPAGLYAATERRPRGPRLVVDAWGDALVAFAWQCLLGLLSGMAGAVGKDARGNLLVPAELAAGPDGLWITPMARHRFYGASGLR